MYKQYPANCRASMYSNSELPAMISTSGSTDWSHLAACEIINLQPPWNIDQEHWLR